MRKVVILIAALCIILSQSVLSLAQTAAIEKIIVAKKAELNNTQWNVTMKPLSGKGKAELDVISFVDGKVSSKNLQNAGFAAVLFSVRVTGDKTTIWEALQQDGNGNYVFWQGNVKDGFMSGILSRRDNKGRTSDFSFDSK